jgi:hypothetical protein
MEKDCYSQFDRIREDMLNSFIERDIHAFTVLLSKLNTLIVKLEDKLSKQKLQYELQKIDRIWDELDKRTAKQNPPKNIF